MKLNEMIHTQYLKHPLVAYPNMALNRNQRVELPEGTEVYLLIDYANQNLLKFEADGKVWFANDNDYFSAIGNRGYKKIMR